MAIDNQSYKTIDGQEISEAEVIKMHAKSEKQFIKKHGELGEALLKEYSLEYAIEAMEFYYVGEFNSRKDFAKSFMTDKADELPEEYKFVRHILMNACDWEYVAWELFKDFTDIEVGNKIHVFRDF